MPHGRGHGGPETEISKSPRTPSPSRWFSVSIQLADRMGMDWEGGLARSEGTQLQPETHQDDSHPKRGALKLREVELPLRQTKNLVFTALPGTGICPASELGSHAGSLFLGRLCAFGRVLPPNVPDTEARYDVRHHGRGAGGAFDDLGKTPNGALSG